MKNIFRKAITVLGSAALIGATVAAASAASYPSPFTSNTAVVVSGSTNAAASDLTGANTIANQLEGVAVGGSTGSISVEGGDSYKIEKSSDNFNLGDYVMDILPQGKLDDNDFSVLADGIYEDSNDEEYDYTQNVYVANETIELIVDKDYADKEPTLGIYIPKDGLVMTYNITFEDDLNVTAMPESDLNIAGKEYYVLTATNTTIELLDTASTSLIAEGESAKVTVGGETYEVSVDVYEDGAIFTVNGEESDQLSTGEYDKLSDDVYIVAKSVRYASKETGISKAEFSIGKGKITLEDTKEVDVNTDNVDGLSVNLNLSTGDLDFIWLADEEIFLTGETGYEEVTMPLFESFKLVFGGVNFPSETEELELVSSEEYITLNTEVLEGSLSLPILYRDSTSDSNFTGLGESSEEVLVTARNLGTDGGSFNVTLNKSEYSSFVATYIKGDEGYTYAYQISSIEDDDGEISEVILTDLVGDSDITFLKLTDDEDRDEITFTLVANSSTETATIQISTSSDGDVYGDRIVTKEGLRVMLPTLYNTTLGGINGNLNSSQAAVYNQTSWDMNITEEDKDGDIASGATFNATIDCTDDDGIHVSAVSLSEQELASDEDTYIVYSMSDLASKVEMDKGGSTNTFVVLYNGEEVTADVYVATGEASVGGSSGDSGVMVYKDSESSSFAGMNIVVVGGSAINSIAAELLGDDYSEGDFTSKTDVSAGEFLIESFSRSGKTALLVAGYNAADTNTAVSYLTNTDNTIDTTAGKKYIGTSATEAELIVA